MTRRRGRFFLRSLFGGLLFPLLPAGCAGTEPAAPPPPPEAVGAAASAVCSASFGQPVFFGLNGPSFAPIIKAVDLNGDGKPEIVAVDQSGSVAVLLNQGGGSFGPAAVYSSGGGEARDFTVADINGDGFPNLVIADYNSHAVSVMMNQGNGTFAAAVFYGVSPYPFSVTAADLNGDGKPDIVVGGESGSASGGNAVSVLLNQGNGTFAAPVIYEAGLRGASVATADLNGDGFLDIVTAEDRFQVNALLNQGDGTFAADVGYNVPASAEKLVVADVNGDGKPDVVTSGVSGASVLLGQGDGTFAATVAYPDSGGAYGIAVGDVNGDGFPDIVAAYNYYGAGSMVVMLNQGDGTFGAPAIESLPIQSNTVSVADLNGDGMPDILLGSGSNALVLFNTSSCSVNLCTTPCTPLDACHVAGTCNPSTGMCSNPAAPDGTACSDGHACTVGDACQSGACAAGPINTTGICTPITVTIQRTGASGTVLDAALDSELPTTNNGASGAIPVGLVAAGKTRASLLSFDLTTIPAGAYIQSATATLTAYSARGSQQTRAHVVTVPWAESTVTWQSFPMSGYQAATAATFPGVADDTITSGVYEPTQADFTAIVQGWYSGATPNNGVLLEQSLTPATQNLTGVTSFWSSEWSPVSLRPSLTIAYIPNF